MNIEDQIRQTVEQQVSTRPPVGGAWERVQHRFRRRQRIRMTAAIAGAAAAIAAVAVIVPRIGSERRVVPIETPAPGPSVISTPTSAAFIPAEVVAHDLGGSDLDDDRIVVISTSTGKVVRVLAERTSASPEGTEPFGRSLGLSADRKTVYFVRHGANWPCESSIMSIPITGGPEQEVAKGISAALSPDGRFLAYVGEGSGGNCNREPLVVRDLQTGDERRWKWTAENPDDPYLQRGPYALAWSPDSRFIAFERNVGDPLTQVWVLDITKGETFLDALKISPDDTEGPGPKTSWSSPAFIDEATVIAAHETRSIHDAPEGPLHIVVTFDAQTPGEPDVLFDPKAAVLDISVDDASGAVVYATGKGIFRLEDGKAELIAAGAYVGADW